MSARALGGRGFRQLLLLLCLGLVTLTGCGPAPKQDADRHSDGSERFHGTWLPDGYPVPPATFTDTLGVPSSEQDKRSSVRRVGRERDSPSPARSERSL